MKMRHLALCALAGALALPVAAAAQSTSSDTGTGGAVDKMKPTTGGVDTRPNEEVLRNREPQMRSNEAQPPVTDPTRPVSPTPNR